MTETSDQPPTPRAWRALLEAVRRLEARAGASKIPAKTFEPPAADPSAVLADLDRAIAHLEDALAALETPHRP